MRARVMRWLWRDDRPEWADPERDQCGRPEHDFCLWCNKRMPGAAR